MIVIVVKKEGIKIIKMEMIKIKLMKLMIVVKKERIKIIKMVMTKMKII